MALEIFRLVGSVFVDTDEANKSLKQSDKDAENLGKKLTSVAQSAGKFALGVVGAATAAGTALVAVAENTREYRAEQGKLQTAFEASGFAAGEAKNTYEALNGILGDSGQAVEAANHLAKLCGNTEDLSRWTKICTGVYATFGDSLPIEGLTEAANETAKVGQVTGPLADALNWAADASETFGVATMAQIKFTKLSKKEIEALTEAEQMEYYQKEELYNAIEKYNEEVREATSAEDKFNLALRACSTEEERQALITETLNKLYANTADKYREVNGEVIAANVANDKLTASMANLGGAVEPIITQGKMLLAEVIQKAIPYIELLASVWIPALIATLMNCATWISENGDKIIEWTGYIVAATAGVSTFLIYLNWNQIMSAASAALNLVTSAVKKMNTTIKSNPIGLLISLITSLIAYLGYLYATNEEFRAFADEMMSALWAKLQNVFAWIEANVLPTIQQIVEWAKANLLPLVYEFVAWMQNTMLPAIQQLIAWVKTHAIALFEEIASWIQNTLLPTIQRLVAWISENVPPVIEKIIGWVKSNLLPAIQSVIAWLHENVPPVVEMIVDWVQNTLLPIIQSVLAWLRENIPLIFQMVVEWVQTKLIPALQSMVAWVQANVIPVIQKVAGWISDTLVPAIGKIITWVKDHLLPVVLDVISWITETIGSFFSWFIGIFQSTSDSTGGIWEKIKGFFKSAWDFIVGIWEACVPFFKGIWDGVIMPVADLVGEIIGAFKMAWDVIKLVWDYVEPYFKAIWEGIKTAVSILWTWLSTGFKNAWEGIKLVWNMVGPYFKVVWETIKGIFSVVATYLGGFFKTAWEAIKAVWNVVIDYFTMVWAGIKAVFAVVKGVLSGDFSDAWEAIKNLWNRAKEFFSSVWTGIKNVFSSAGSWFGDTFKAAWNAIKNVFSAWGSFFGNLWTQIKDKFSAIGTNISNAISSSVKAGLNGVISAIEGIINTGVNLINGAINLINNIPGVSIGKLSKLSLPRLERGGVLEKGQVGLLEGNGAEAVVPLHQNEKWIKAVAEDMESAIGGASNNQENIEQFIITIVSLLEKLLVATEADHTISLNKREFARLVKEVG